MGKAVFVKIHKDYLRSKKNPYLTSAMSLSLALVQFLGRLSAISLVLVLLLFPLYVKGCIEGKETEPKTASGFCTRA